VSEPSTATSILDGCFLGFKLDILFCFLFIKKD
jgi:hypothetical protein